MVEQLELTVDVTEAAGLGEPASIALTVSIPRPERDVPPTVVCFAKPGAGFSRAYYTSDLPGPARGSQAAWHAERGWIFVSVDHLGVGDSSHHHDPALLTYANVAAASHAAELDVLERLGSGTLHPKLPPVASPIRLGIGQSMGGCLTIAQQGRRRCYDGIAVLGFSAVHTHPPAPPGEPPIVAAWRVPGERPGDPPITLNEARFSDAFRTARGAEPSSTNVLASGPSTNVLWHYYYDDMAAPPLAQDPADTQPWVSSTVPGLVTSVLTPGIVAPEAAAVDVPVLVALGERDVVADPKGEPRAYHSAASVDLYVCPRMGHMHNFAGTRELFWRRIETWAEWVAAWTRTHRGTPPADPHL